jgi:hypothetical protein
VSSGGAPDEVLKFVDRYIDSVEQLEILLILCEGERDWSAAEIFQRIQSSAGSIQQRLSGLTQAGLLTESNGRFRFAPRDESMRQVMHDLAEAYRERRVRIIEAIYTRKTDAVQTFADAFKFKKKD